MSDFHLEILTDPVCGVFEQPACPSSCPGKGMGGDGDKTGLQDAPGSLGAAGALRQPPSRTRPGGPAQATTRFGWMPPRVQEDQDAPKKPSSARSAYFPDDPEEESMAYQRPQEPREQPKATPSSASSRESAIAARPGKALFRLDHLISVSERLGGGAHATQRVEEGASEGEEGGGIPDRILPPSCCRRTSAAPVFFGDIRFPASRCILWPRHASSPPLFLTSTDIAPLLVLRTAPLRPLLTKLFTTTTTTRRPRGTLLRLSLVKSSSTLDLPLSLARRNVVCPPACALTLHLDQDLEPYLLEAPNVEMLCTQLLDAAQAKARGAPPPSAPQGGSVSSSSSWTCYVPVIEVPGGGSTTAAAESPWSCEATSEAGYRSLLSWYTHDLTEGGEAGGNADPSLSATQALAPMRILATASGPDSLCLRVEQVVPALTIRFTPLEPLPALNTPLWATLSEQLTAGSSNRSGSRGADGPQWGYLTLNDTRKVVVLLPSDPLVQERPLVGVWIANVTKDWEAEGHQHPLVWSTLLRYSLSQQIKERVSVEAQTVLLAWFPSRPQGLEASNHAAASPSFYECKLLWPLPPPPPNQPLPLSFRLLDFSVDLTIDDDDGYHDASAAGLQQQSTADEWHSPPVVGHFREVGHPSIATAFFRSQHQSLRQQRSPSSLSDTPSLEHVSALTMESRFMPVTLSRSPTPQSRRPPPPTTEETPTPQPTTSTSRGPPPPPPPPSQPSPSPPPPPATPSLHPGGPSGEQRMAEPTAGGEPAFVVKGVGGGDGGGGYQQASATHQLILAQQQHLYILQRQVQQLQALLVRQQQQQPPPPEEQPPAASQDKKEVSSTTTHQSMLLLPRGGASAAREGGAQAAEARQPPSASLLDARGINSSDGMVIKPPCPPSQSTVPASSDLPQQGGASPHKAVGPEEAAVRQPHDDDDEEEEDASMMAPIELLKVPSLDDIPPIPPSPSSPPSPPRRTPPPPSSSPPRGHSTTSSPSPPRPKRTIAAIGGGGGGSRSSSRTSSPVRPPATIHAPHVAPEDQSSALLNTYQALSADDIPRIVYAYSSGDDDDEGGNGDGGDSDGEGETIIRIEQKYRNLRA